MGYAPKTYSGNPGVVSGSFSRTPMGIILHGSRSGINQPVKPEFDITRRYAVNEPNGYGWNATIGDDEVAIHFPSTQWGWNARGASPRYLAVEFAQGVEADPITDGQVRAFCWWVENYVLPTYPNIDLTSLPTHAELDGTAIYGGKYDGKTDTHHKGSPLADDLRHRIWDRLDVTPDNGDDDVAKVAELESLLGYLMHDVADALQNGLAGARAAKTDADRTDALDSIQAAISTLKRGG